MHGQQNIKFDKTRYCNIVHLLAWSWILTISAWICIAQNTHVDFVTANTYG